jgi:hypothetical protein
MKFAHDPQTLHTKHSELLYDDIHPNNITLSNKYYVHASEDPYVNVPLAKIIDSQDIDDFAFLMRDDILNINTLDDVEGLLIDQTVFDVNIEDNIPDKIKAHRKDIIDLLDNRAIKHIEYDECEKERRRKYKSVTTTEINEINRDCAKPHEVLVVDQMMITKFVDDKNTLRKEAEKIKRYLLEALYLEGSEAEQNEDKLYGTLRFVYYNGYLHIFRAGIPLKEVITHELLDDTEENPKLEILGKNEYGIPIRHNVLKYILFQNEIQRELYVDQKLLAEAEIVLGQEYIIALTPEPRYQIWCVMRLIKLWYGDIDLQNNIRKIKLIVNQYRTRSDRKYNIQNGIRFSIGIYPRYGKASASVVLKKMMYYFAIYLQAVGWRENPPSYFKIVNDLISYTNCDQSLKLYYRRVAEVYGQKNTVFSKNYTTINNAGKNTDILEQYIQL